MDTTQGFIYCAVLNGQGAAQEVTEYTKTWQEKTAWVWYHLDYTDESVGTWLTEHSGLSDLTIEILTSEDTRPRSLPADQGLLICLRGVNCNPGQDPDDMVSLRLWIGENRIITMRHRRAEAINDIRQALTQGHGPENMGDFLVFLCERLTDRMSDVVSDIDDKVDAMEDRCADDEAHCI